MTCKCTDCIHYNVCQDYDNRVTLDIYKIEELKYDYKVKHRFDKPPLAKCYCKDCKYHEDNGKCYSFTKRHTEDNWFCSWAERKRVKNEQEKA